VRRAAKIVSSAQTDGMPSRPPPPPPLDGGAIVTVTDWFALPPVPLQVSVKVLLLVSAEFAWLPDVALPPDHAPEALQPVALVLVQLSVVVVLLGTLAGFAVSVTVGAGGVGLTRRL
jgi:hypothetical protein